MRIGELARITKTKTETIRFYEKEGLLPRAARTSANYRSYGNEHGQRLSFIRRARDLGFRLDDVRELLALADDRSRSCGAVDEITTRHLEEIDAKIADLAKMRAELSRILTTCEQGTIDDCRIIETLGPCHSA
ncbi:helix-turn-helix domain-containing protein [Sphingopyxis sp. OPL5]|uniref:MerR family transcriptional regulator n=1 Tax=Sphingopyxis sp. OPL5 TaxID=2486273 RepID=UPI00164D5248|nr:helix-turn-helix domain-containing protein [Sphingopyxis sp. OPL5]QNO25576.1 helix-turn-helix domain-containing protein [Sphingopyxis sp. OPL5]